MKIILLIYVLPKDPFLEWALVLLQELLHLQDYTTSRREMMDFFGMRSPTMKLYSLSMEDVMSLQRRFFTYCVTTGRGSLVIYTFFFSLNCYFAY